MNSTQQAQLQQVQSDVRTCCEASTQLNSKVDALQDGLSAVVKLLTQVANFQAQSSTSAAVEVPCKRARTELASSAVSPLDDNEIFGSVLSYVGFGEYFFVAGVCRRWRGAYISFCYANTKAAETRKLRTLRRAVITTAARLQLALHNGATLAVLDAEAVRSSYASLANSIPRRSLEPIAVLTLLRVYGYQWDSDLYIAAAEEGNLELIKWLHQVQCPEVPFKGIALRCCGCMSSSAVSILQWLHSLQPEWFNEIKDGIANKTSLLYSAGEYGNLALVQWVRCELNAQWPDAEDIIYNDDEGTIVPCWEVEAVIWALDNGFDFEFECSKLDIEKYTNPVYRADALMLWQWLHKESNRHRCTCSNA
jgi:hypothetical protein